MAQLTPINPLDFLKELVARIGKKNPKFYNILATVFGIATFITGVPALLEAFGVVLPEALQAISSKTVSIAGLVAVFLTNLPLKDPEVVHIEPAKFPVTNKAQHNEEVKIQNALGK